MFSKCATKQPAEEEPQTALKESIGVFSVSFFFPTMAVVLHRWDPSVGFVSPGWKGVLQQKSSTERILQEGNMMMKIMWPFFLGKGECFSGFPGKKKLFPLLWLNYFLLKTKVFVNTMLTWGTAKVSQEKISPNCGSTIPWQLIVLSLTCTPAR